MWNTTLKIYFNKRNYEVKNSQEKVIYKKKYGEQLIDEEINQLVNAEIRLHKAFIEKKMKEVENGEI